MAEKLGEGSYGVVFSAKCLSNAAGLGKDSLVAVKMISSAFQKNSLLAKRTLREVAMLRRFVHPNVVSILDFYRAKGRLFMVLPLMDTDLAQIIDSPQPLRHAHVVYLTHQLLSGLNYLHAAGIVHRDVRKQSLEFFFLTPIFP